MKEEWRDVPCYKGFYQASNLGRIKSLARWSNCGRKGQMRNERILPGFKSKAGYLKVKLCKNGAKRTYCIHQVIAMAFKRHKPNGCKTNIDHINRIKTDNRVKNLRITTPRGNSSNRTDHGKSKYVGVSWHKKDKKWRSRIRLGDKQIFLGNYDTEIEASKAYKAKLKSILNGEC